MLEGVAYPNGIGPGLPESRFQVGFSAVGGTLRWANSMRITEESQLST
jgi:hypothetical protein